MVPFLALVCGGTVLAQSSTPESAITGDLRRHREFASRFVAPRNVDVWLPPSYASQPERRFPVLYMHDGQNLFDPATSMNRTDWGVDETMTRLIASGSVREAIVVGIWNTPKRWQEYMPEKAAIWGWNNEHRPALRRELDRHDIAEAAREWLADAYLRFLVRELKPFIDREYRTLPGAADTSIMGSSMGGLISLYAVCEYPQIFGSAGCVSTHWPSGDGVVIAYLRGNLPDPATHQIYFDFGTETLDRAYAPYQDRMDEQMQAAGYVRGANWETRKFEGAAHDEKSWRARVGVPLQFLLGR